MTLSTQLRPLQVTESCGNGPSILRGAADTCPALARRSDNPSCSPVVSSNDTVAEATRLLVTQAHAQPMVTQKKPTQKELLGGEKRSTSTPPLLASCPRTAIHSTPPASAQ